MLLFEKQGESLIMKKVLIGIILGVALTLGGQSLYPKVASPSVGDTLIVKEDTVAAGAPSTLEQMINGAGDHPRDHEEQLEYVASFPQLNLENIKKGTKVYVVDPAGFGTFGIGVSLTKEKNSRVLYVPEESVDKIKE